MSQGQPVPLEQARAVAEELVELLRPDCARIQIAGSIRRRRPEVRDIEIVAIPHRATQIVSGLFSELEETREHNLLEQGLRVLIDDERLIARQVEAHRRDGSIDVTTKLGPAYKALVCQRFFRRVEGGRVLHLGRPVATPEEADFFTAVGQPWVEPWERSVERVDVRRSA